MRSRVLLTLAVSSVLVLVPAFPAFAGDPDGWVDVDPDGSHVDVGASDGSVRPVRRGGGESTSRCSWTRVPDDEVDHLWWNAGSEVGSGIADEGGAPDPAAFVWYWKSCPADGGAAAPVLVPVPRDSEPVDPVDLREEAMDRLQLPTPTIEFNPPSDQVVHVESWLWIDDAIWREHSKSVTAGEVTVTATARPRRVIWSMGNGDVVVCDGPGTPYDATRPPAEQSTSCAYTYQHSSAGQPGHAYRVTADIEWDVSWTVTGAPGGGALPTLTTSSATSVRVAEMQALNQ